MLSSLGLVNPKIELNHFRLNINWHRLCFSQNRFWEKLIWNPIYFLWSCFAPKRKERLLFQIWPRASNSQWLIWQTPQLLRLSERNWKEILELKYFQIFSNYFPRPCHHNVKPCEVHSESWFPLRESCRCLNVRYFLSYYDVEGVDRRNQQKISTEVVSPGEPRKSV